ncbi:MAG: FtsX-like permease family protein, partial [Gammaproteobacteria bacterium]|nr:FtsX-like permease family protein [Gammaproteobacteria bacterium]
IDVLLERYGGVSAIPRADQISNWFTMNELEQMREMSSILPTIFLTVAAFLCYMVLGRLIATERSEIGLFKAFGYSNFEIGWHYTKLVIAIAVIGSVLGWVLGGYLGRVNTELYAETYRFPLLIYRPSTTGFLVAGAVSLVATLLGALGAVRRAVKLPPAEAMRPPAPTVYRQGGLGATRLGRWLDQPTRIALRQIGRYPLRAGLTCVGLASAVGLLILALQWDDSLDYIAQTYFFQSQHQSMSVGLAEPQAITVVQEFEHLPGVLAAEPWRTVAADISAGATMHRGGVIGLSHDNQLKPIYDEATAAAVPVPEAGIVLGTYLAQKLNVGVGDSVWVDVLEGRRPSGELQVAGLFETTIAMPAYMNIDVLNGWLKLRPTVEYIDLLVDPAEKAGLFAALKATPEVSAVMVRQAALDAFNETVGHNILVYIFMFTGFAGALAFGVAYNSTRIALSERGRELATLRVLGFTRGEITYILLSEVALLIFVALPLGCLFGFGLSLLIATTFDTELFRMPLAISGSTYGIGVLFTIFATTASALLVRRRIVNLDLISVLKTRE